MGPKELKKTLMRAIVANYPLLIKGAPGVGKSDVVAEATKEVKHELFITHPVVKDPTNYEGLGAIVMNKGKPTAEFLPFGDLRLMIEAKQPTVVFIDDLGQAPSLVQAACMQLILAREINGQKISDKIVFVAATNRREDRAAVTGILEPIKGRFHSIVQLDADADNWCEWAIAHDMPAEVIGFIHFRPDLICTNGATADIVNHPNPRNWFHVGQWLKIGVDALEIIAGAVGEGAAIELQGFIKIYNELPSIDAILMRPNEEPVPTSPAAQYAVATALLSKISIDNAGRVFAYANRLPSDISTMLAIDAIRKEPKIKKTTAFVQWGIKHQDVLM